MQIHEIQDLSNEIVTKLLIAGLSSVDDHVAENYCPEFENSPANLFYILRNGRYKTGKYYVLEDNNEYVASAGWYEYDPETALLMTRSYTSKKYRTEFLLGKVLLPKMIEECSHYKKLWITFNKYNKAFYDWISRADPGDNAYWPEPWHRFKPIGMRNIHYTDQYVVELTND